MLPDKVQLVVDDLVRFHCRNIEIDAIYVVVQAGGAARFNWLQMNSAKPCNVVPTKDGLIPIRDHYIYAVAKSGKPRVGEVTVATADLLHTKMCATGKKGADITLGEVHTAARAEVLARLTDAGVMVDDTKTDTPDLVDGILGQAVDPDTVDPSAKLPLPLSAVQIVVGDTIMSEPFRTEKEAQESAQYAAYGSLPEVVDGSKMLWLRPLSDNQE